MDAYASARPRMMQLTTISGMNRPSDADSEGMYACSSRSIMVTKPAMTVMYAAMRTLLGIIFRSAEMTMLEQISTAVAARPMPMPFSTEVEVARVGHMPIS